MDSCRIKAVAEENCPCVRKLLQMTDDHSDITRLKRGWTIWSFDLTSTLWGDQFGFRFGLNMHLTMHGNTAIELDPRG